MSRARWFPLSAVLGAWVLAVPSEGALQPEPQQRPTDRRAYLNDVQTSDDPRRVPAPPGPRGPEGTTVLRGGLVFDGTGSEPVAGTVVMERNRIAAVHGPSLQRQDSQSTGLMATPRPHRPARTESHMISGTRRPQAPRLVPPFLGRVLDLADGIDLVQPGSRPM